MIKRDSNGRFIKGSRPDNYKHGMKDTRLYGTWCNMKARCLNPKNKKYSVYGGRGITVCEEWMEFLPFMEWAGSNGYTDKLTIERDDVDKGYSPSNCRFIPMSEQSRNKQLLSSVNTSGYCGVSRVKNSRYQSYVKDYTLGKKMWLGTFKSPIAAALVRDTYIIDNNLDLSLNFTYVDSL